MRFFDQNFREILPSEIISVIGGVLAGTVLAIYTDKILLIPGMIILLPGFLEMRGNISGSFASRLSSGLFLKVIHPRKPERHIIQGNLFASFLLAIITSLALGLIAFLFNYFVLHALYFRIILLPFLAGIIANAIEIPLTLFTTLYLFRKGHDPNNIMGPFITTTGDITSILALLASVLLL